MGSSPTNHSKPSNGNEVKEEVLKSQRKKSSIIGVLGTKLIQKNETKHQSQDNPFKFSRSQTQNNLDSEAFHRSKTKIETETGGICPKCLTKFPCIHTSFENFKNALHSLSPQPAEESPKYSYRRSYTNKAVFKEPMCITLEQYNANLTKSKTMLKLPEIASPRLRNQKGNIYEKIEDEIKRNKRYDHIKDKKEKDYEKILEEIVVEENFRKDTIKRLETMNFNSEKKLKVLEGKIARNNDRLRSNVKGNGGRYNGGMWALI
ncbi:unnamed protein product [Blepharisma stoltei]|uniref:Uncharacterized protein n=1 Tax=Blepharisma stoltei TaxID=1481888 RepID=A0AAU9KM41_9CILI|nr:unnamed protein product [Blepharisma stoltei]